MGLTRIDLDALDDDALISACLAPVIARIRGRGFNVKWTEYGGLPPAQRALLAFHVLNGHAREVTSFWFYVGLFAMEWNVWSQLEDSARLVGDCPRGCFEGRLEGHYIVQRSICGKSAHRG